MNKFDQEVAPFFVFAFEIDNLCDGIKIPSHGIWVEFRMTIFS